MTRSRCNDWQMFEEDEARRERYEKQREAIKRFVPLGGMASEDHAREADETEAGVDLRGQRSREIDLGGILAQPVNPEH